MVDFYGIPFFSGKVYPIPSMGLVYLPTFVVEFMVNVVKYTVRPMDDSWEWVCLEIFLSYFL